MAFIGQGRGQALGPLRPRILKTAVKVFLMTKYLEFVTTGEDAGNITLASTDARATGNYFLITGIEVVVSAGASTDFDVEIFEDDDFASSQRYKNETLNSTSHCYDECMLEYQDRDEAKSIYVKITDNDTTGAPKFDIAIYAVQLT